MAKGPLISISDYDPDWPARFAEVAEALRATLGDEAIRIDHIGSTSVPNLAAKDLIDLQITVEHLAAADAWPDELLPGLHRQPEILADHVPAGAPSDAGWAKRYWSDARNLHVHVRAVGSANQRYALLFRDYLRADRLAADSYGALKRALATVARDDWDVYYDVKDPACDLIIAGAEQWAARIGWTAPAADR